MKKLELINEQTSPLFRIMWVSDVDDITRRKFNNNISAFHIGKGFILSVAHNLRTECLPPSSLPDSIFQAEIFPNLDQNQAQLFEQLYPLDVVTNKRYFNFTNNNDLQTVIQIFQQIGFDTRWVTMAQKDIYKMFLIVQFTENKFYNSDALTRHFNESTYFHEPQLNRHTYLIEVELVEAFYEQDIALYRIKDTHKSIIKGLPSVQVDFSLLKDSGTELYCVQSSPGGFVGHLMNKANIEGYLDNHSILPDRIGGNYILQGLRYLIKGYFRFGSSGAPYVFYDTKNKKYKVNAVQSEACPIQLSIGGSQNGNYQYINALASPLNLVKDKLEDYLR